MTETLIPTEIRLFTAEEFAVLVEKTGNFFEYDCGKIVWRQASDCVPPEMVEQLLANENPQTILPIEKIMASLIHEKIISNLHIRLGMLLAEKPFTVYSQGTYLAVSSEIAQYRIPDLVVAPENEERNERNYLLNQIVLVEVQSDSTAGKDRNEKLQEYTQIDTLQNYLLISQHDILLEHYSRISEKKWAYELFDQINDQVELAALAIRFSLKEVYEKALKK